MAKKKFKKRPFKKWLDNLCKNVIKARDGRVCQKCGVRIINPYDCQWSHIKSRKANATRWLLTNALTLCGRCHAWAHANPDEYGLWFASQWPQSARINIEEAMNIHPWKQWDFEDAERYLLEKSIDFDMPIEWLEKQYQVRYKAKIKELRNDY